tara:strand:- start:3623 stop:4093 length:471 start_codon:yes stop_codon:yes gene_type:complete
MIIKCNKCNKKFNLDDRLITNDGRLLKCGNCNNEWFYKPTLVSNTNFQDLDNKTKIPKKVKTNESKENITIFETKNNENVKLKNTTKEEKLIKKMDKSKYILNYIIIFIISFIAILIILDTFKIHLSKILPNIIPFLNSLYESLYDLKLFLKDLFN